MKRVSSIALLAAAVLALSGCMAFVAAPIGGAYTDVRAPITATAYPTASKTGTATCTSILGLVATGDCSIAAAMQQGGITRVQTVDMHATSVFGLYATYTVVVRGE
jgi:hypothetical protein